MVNQPASAGAVRRVSVVGLMVFAGAVWIAPARAAAEALSNPTVRFTVVASNGAKIVGTGTEIKLESRGPWLTFRVPLSSVSTKSGSRDRQMRDRYLEADTHPTVELKISREALKGSKGGGLGEGNTVAKLSLHGKSLDVTVHYSLERSGESLNVKGSFDIDLRAHGIDVPNYRGITVNPKVAVDVSFGTVDREMVADATSI
jgi:polyisoprenoid-binding protein YceI